MAAGYQIKAETAKTVVADQPWFTDFSGTYGDFSAGIGDTTFLTAGIGDLAVGDAVAIFATGGTAVNLSFANVIAIPDVDQFTIDVQIAGSGSGIWFRIASLTWDETTPKNNFVREVQVQFSTSILTGVQISFDNGQTYFDLTNASSLLGLHTLTLLIEHDDLLNFKSTLGNTISIIVTGN